jgi:hypothetical protein
MKWLFEQPADLVAWTLDEHAVTLEIVLCGDDELPASGKSAASVRILGPGSVDGIEAHLAQFGGELRALGVDTDSDGRTLVTIEGEWEPLVLACKAVDSSWKEPERRYYERVVARYWECTAQTNGEIRRLGARLRRVEVFLAQQADRAQRIISEVSCRYPDARVRVKLEWISSLSWTTS